MGSTSKRKTYIRICLKYLFDLITRLRPSNILTSDCGGRQLALDVPACGLSDDGAIAAARTLISIYSDTLSQALNTKYRSFG